MAETILHKRQRLSQVDTWAPSAARFAGDADWYRIGMDPNDGLSLTLRSEDGEPVDAYLFAADLSGDNPFFAQPMQVTDWIMHRALQPLSLVEIGTLLVTGQGPRDQRNL